MQVRSLASLCGLRIQCCHEIWWRSQTWLGSVIAVAVADPGSCSSDSTSILGTYICCRRGTKKKKKKKKNKFFFHLSNKKIKIINLQTKYSRNTENKLVNKKIQDNKNISLLLNQTLENPGNISHSDLLHMAFLPYYYKTWGYTKFPFNLSHGNMVVHCLVVWSWKTFHSILEKCIILCTAA